MRRTVPRRDRREIQYRGRPIMLLIIDLVMLQRPYLAPTRPDQTVHVTVEGVFLRILRIASVALRPPAQPVRNCWERAAFLWR